MDIREHRDQIVAETAGADPVAQPPTLAERSQSQQDATARLGERVSTLEKVVDQLQLVLQNLLREVGLDA